MTKTNPNPDESPSHELATSEDRGTDLSPSEQEICSDGRPWDRNLVSEEIHFWDSQVKRSVYEIGRRLLWTRAVLDPEAFRSFCELHLPFKERAAQMYMQIARFLIRKPTLRKPLEVVGIKKLHQIAQLPPEILDLAIGEDGIASLGFNEIADVPYTELRRRCEILTEERDRLMGRLEDEKRDREEEADASQQEIRQLKTQLVDATIRRGKQDDKTLNELVNKAARAFDDTMVLLEGILDDLAAKLPEASPAVQARICGLVEHIEQRPRFEAARFRYLQAEDVQVAASYMDILRDVLSRPIPGGKGFAVEEERLPLGVSAREETRQPPRPRKPKLQVLDHPKD